MRAVVLVGGFGTRLLPLTLSIPKPMLPVGHVPIIERLVAQLGRGGISDVTLALGFKPEPFVEAFPSGECGGVALHYAVEPQPLDTAGAIRFAATASGIDETFVVVNGDVLTDLDVAQLVRFHRDRGAEATLHLIAVPDPSAFGVVALDGEDRVERFVEKPAPGTAPSNLVNAGTYVLEPSVLRRIPGDEKISIERATFPAIADGRGLFGLATDDYWIDTGQPEFYLQANLDVLAGLRRNDRCQAVHPDANVDGTATIENALIGPGATVGAGAVVRRTVVLSGAAIGEGAAVTDSVIMGQVGPNASVHDCVIGATGVIGSGEHLHHQRRPQPAPK
ncbi:MAG: NDP-sugar synthase [Actinobacteria bacterium]|nr:NDP-sugar synthase [Actinomycetota bacterium]